MSKLTLILFFAIVCSYTTSHKLHKQVMEHIETQPTKTMFKLWHYAFNRDYDINSEIGLQKYKIFKDNVKFIKEENAKNLGYTLGLGPFTDRTFEDVEKNILTYKPKDLPAPEEIARRRKMSWFDDMVDEEENVVPVPKKNKKNNKKALKTEGDRDDNNDDFNDEMEFVSKDWTDTWGYVKKQGDCGSCWAFAAIATVEAQAIAKGFTVTKYSEQQLIDCDKISNGCEGGNKEYAFIYIKEFGLMAEEDYKYKEKNQTCKYQGKKVVLETHFDYCSFSYYLCTDKILKEMISKGPYATCVMADKLIVNYSKGRLRAMKCHTCNHAVTVTQLDYAEGIIKFRNSWGEEWGENGNGILYMDTYEGLRGCGMMEWAYIPDGMTDLA